jgi:hypothetical protein
MLTAEARVPTDRASRYLVQFCRHASHMGQPRGHRSRPHGGGGAPPEVRHVAWSDTLGTVRFGCGHCVLQATEDTLILSVDAADEDNLQRLLDGIARRLVTIGRRDQLTVNWQRPDSAPDLASSETTSATPAHTATAATRQHRGLTSTLLLTGAAALVIVVHLGLLGGALSASTWTHWTSSIILAVILLKVITISVHVLLGRSALRRGKTLAARRKQRRSPPDSAPQPQRWPARTVKEEHP